MISQLKQQSGYQWTNKLEGMFKDIVLSKDIMNRFESQYPQMTKSIKMNTKICTSSYWPNKNVIKSATIPLELKSLTDQFTSFYIKQFNETHRLEYHLNQGTAEILVLFSPKVKRILVCTTIQMMIMCCFNLGLTSNGILSLQQMLDTTGLPIYELEHHLISLCHPKVAILKKPNTMKLDKSHLFMINNKYNNKLMKVKVPLMINKRQDDQIRQEEIRLQKIRRQHQMEAAIVRIMKTRKTLTHQLLISEVIQQLSSRFVPSPIDIKKRIESLIEQEYIERDANKRGTYNYVSS